MTIHTQDRLGWIDAAKGIGITLVVLGHAFRPGMLEVAWCDFLFRLIYSIHMPLFFVLSGFTFALTYRKHLTSPASFLQKRTKTLLIPLLTWGTVIYLCFLFAYQIPYFAQMLSSADFEWVDPLRYLYLMFVWENPYAAHLWYVWVLLVITLLAYFCAKLLKDSPRWQTVFALLSLPCYAAALLLPIPTAIRKMLAYMLFFAAGILFAKFPDFFMKRSVGSTVASLTGGGVLIGIALLATTGLIPQSGVWLHLQNLALTVSVFPAILGLFRLCQGLSRLPLLTKLGRESFAVYLLHQPFFGGLAGIVLYNTLGLPIVVVLAACTLLCFLIPLTVVWIARRVRWIGRVTRLLLNI